MSQDSETRALIRQVIRIGGLSLRDIDAGDPPFLYSSGNKGPGYVMIKGLVSQRMLLSSLVMALSRKVAAATRDIEYVAGNATGGMIPAWMLADCLSTLYGRGVPYFYVRETRKKGGHGETITGDKLNDFFAKGRRGIVMEELVNFAQTTVNSAELQREAGYVVHDAATILFYDHAKANEQLAAAHLNMTHLFTLEHMLQEAEEMFPSRLIADYRAFLADPPVWMAMRGFKKEVV